jgi:hypothetical protein
VLLGADDESTALAGYERTRLSELAEIFELTCELVTYPPVPEFVELTRRLGGAIDAAAALLAARTVPGAVDTFQTTASMRRGNPTTR